MVERTEPTVSGGSNPTPSLQYVVHITTACARSFVEHWHYSKKLPTGKNINFGWYINGKLYAVAVYGIGVNAYQASFLSRMTSKKVTNKNLVELKRLCRIEPKNDAAQLTRFLSICQRMLKKSGYCFVVSFSDPAHNHTGGIYKAANFRYLGKTNPEFHLIDEKGVIRHRRYAYRYARRKGISIPEARKILRLKRVRTAEKDRWFLCL